MAMLRKCGGNLAGRHERQGGTYRESPPCRYPEAPEEAARITASRGARLTPTFADQDYDVGAVAHLRAA